MLLSKFSKGLLVLFPLFFQFLLALFVQISLLLLQSPRSSRQRLLQFADLFLQFSDFRGSVLLILLSVFFKPNQLILIAFDLIPQLFHNTLALLELSFQSVSFIKSIQLRSLLQIQLFIESFRLKSTLEQFDLLPQLRYFPLVLTWCIARHSLSPPLFINIARHTIPALYVSLLYYHLFNPSVFIVPDPGVFLFR